MEMSHARLTCEPCRERKVKCDKALPECGICARRGYECSYRNRITNKTRQQLVIQELQKRVDRAEARLAASTRGTHSSSRKGSTAWNCQEEGLSDESKSVSPISIPPTPTNGRRSSRSLVPTSLSSHEFYESQAVEGILCASGDGEVLGHTGPDEFPPELNMGMDASTDLQMMTFSPDTVGSFLGPSTWWAADISTPLSATGLLSVTPEILGRLHETFFNAFSDALPIIARDNFYSRLREFPTSLPILAVTYSVALLGTLVSDEYRHLEKSCCGLARQYLDACESDDLSDSLASITVLQALLCLIRFDICKRNCPRAYITFGRAERLASMMRLHHMDKSKTGCTNQASPRTAALHIKLPSTQVLIELEERRRCYWALFIFGGYVSIYNNTVVPYDQNSTICLPCPGDLGSTFHPQGMPCIDDAIEHGASGPISPFAGLVLVVALIRRALDHAMQTRRSEGGFWDRHYALTKHIEERGALLRPMFALRRLSSDAMALDVHLGFHAAEMIMCRTALDESARQGLSDILSCEPKKRLLAAALKVASTIRLTWSLQRQNVDKRLLSGAFVAWPLSLAIQVIRRDATVESQDCAQHIQILCGALDDVEALDGPWHKAADVDRPS